ncbi:MULTISPECIES: hormogonium polysaccharide biosynthesis protein HpsA [Moorena]|uniref:Uncharacterized protein n=3 Tax=Moorena TaxID=1155738 RepID=F4XQX6_9CYAN|nr:MULTISPECIES: hormogonium polysaccharide biosynthesis protein HpsA [Moorena]EGJ32951.1 hypothetical protein LYNGBM3L_55410 [Moorena producens 3L]NEP64056.1 hypothetical protein [Moorena sp. SIO3A5]NES43470.1 hypothetical protein [Moorena sp. SIO2C4]OLT68329.1 hypothetical protein BI334_27950 [Moorena producens 3L]
MSTRKSTRKKLANAIAKLLKQVVKLSQAITKPLMRWLLRSLFILHRRSRVATAGFVLPTAIMVTLVVTLLVTAIVLRSFDRVKNASNYRVNQAVFNAAAPAIERAQAKLEALFADPTLPRSTPSEEALENAFKNTKYNFGDETRLTLEDEVTQDTIDTAWRFPVDTDNNGLFDSYTLYGIYFKSPQPNQNQNQNPLRNPDSRTSVQARTPPMGESNDSDRCPLAGDTSASLVDNSGWFKSGSKLKKSIFVYTATVPIVAGDNNIDGQTYEAYKGEAGFSALEYQQDRARIPLANNAIVYEDDLQITPGDGIQINGRIFTNGNFLTGNRRGNNEYFQVSSPKSCYYKEENSKIIVGGNMAFGRVDQKEHNNKGGKIHLFNGNGAPNTNVNLGQNDKSVDETPDKIGDNSQAYTARINDLVKKQFDRGGGTDPREVEERYEDFDGEELDRQRLKALRIYFKDRTRRVPYAEIKEGGDPGNANLQGTGNELRPEDKWIFPYKPGTTNSNNKLKLNITGNKLSPAATEPSLQEDQGKERKIGDRVLIGHGLPARWWDNDAKQFQGARAKQDIDKKVEWDNFEDEDKKVRFRTTQVTPLSELGDTDRNGFWERKAAQQPSQPLEGIGGLRVVTGAGIYVDDDESDLLPRIKGQPDFPRDNRNTLNNPDLESYLPPPAWDIRFVDPGSRRIDDRIQVNDITAQLRGFPIVVWPDTMPMHGGVDGDLTGNNNGMAPNGDDITDFYQKSDLLMRASAVYHYTQNPGKNPEEENGNFDQEPIACVSSYYDPTDEASAYNAFASGDQDWDNERFDPGNPNQGRSNNGIVYPFPGRNAGDSRLRRQSQLVFPNGRLVNEPLNTALFKPAGERTLADNSAIDTASCALAILDGSATPMGSPPIPHGAIYEQSFLNARQVQDINQAPNQSNNYNLSEHTYDLGIEDRQPLEIRTTVLDLNLLRTTEIGTSPKGPSPEFLLPDSGVIYATRDDALPDLSQNDPNATPQENLSSSSVDFTVDPTRRPNGIMLRNGTVLARKDESNSFKLTDPPGAEKGLILATNLPVYIKADPNVIAGSKIQSGFNLHQTPGGKLVEEFKDRLLQNDEWDDGENGNFYGRDTLEENFACRKEDDRLPNCNSGDLWRPAVVIADSVTLLSNNFEFGYRSDGDYDLRGIPMGSNLDPDDDLIDPVNEANFNNADLNGNGVRGDTQVLESQIVIGYDVNGDGDLTDTFNEPDINFNPDTNQGFDLNGDGDTTDISVPESEIHVAVGLKLNGIFDNNFVTSANWWDVDGTPGIDTPDANGNPQPSTLQNPNGRTVNSSYLSNFVTPIQRRVEFPEYVMEICRKVPVSACRPEDWVVSAQGVNPPQRASDLVGNNVNLLFSGTTAKPAIEPKDRRYPRRIAFKRDTGNKLELDSDNLPTPLGINGTDGTVDNSGTVAEYPYNTFNPTNRPRLQPHALWYRTTRDPLDFTNTALSFGTDRPLFFPRPLNPTTEQPMLVPVLQVHSLTAEPGRRNNGLPIREGECVEIQEGWTQRANPNQNPDGETFNLVIASGDSPPSPTENNGGVANFVRYLENWRQPGGSCRETDGIPARISGSLIQFKRSAYDTAPFWHGSQNAPNEIVPSRFGYQIDDDDRGNGSFMPYAAASGRLPYYMAPKRRYGFDVALLTQLPDLFSGLFTTPSAGDPDEFFREVSRDDSWVETLLCAKDDKGNLAVNGRYCRK